MPSVELISVTPVKCFALNHPESIELNSGGVLENRRFLLVDGENRRLRSSLTSWPMVLHAHYDVPRERLAFAFLTVRRWRAPLWVPAIRSRSISTTATSHLRGSSKANGTSACLRWPATPFG